MATRAGVTSSPPLDPREGVRQNGRPMQHATRGTSRLGTLCRIAVVVVGPASCGGQSVTPASDASAIGSSDALQDTLAATDSPAPGDATIDSAAGYGVFPSEAGFPPDAGSEFDACVMPDSSVSCVTTEGSNNCCQVCGMMGCACQFGHCVQNHQQ